MFDSNHFPSDFCHTVSILQRQQVSHISVSHTCSWWLHINAVINCKLCMCDSCFGVRNEAVRESSLKRVLARHTTWWQLKAFITEASLRNSILSRRLADSLTVLTATRVSGSPLTMSLAIPSYTIPKEPWPSSLSTVIFSRGTSHSSGTYTTQNTHHFDKGDHSQSTLSSCFVANPYHHWHWGTQGLRRR